MIPALLLVYRDAHFTELFRAAKAMRATKRFDPQFIFLFPYAALPRDLAIARKEGFTCLAENGDPIGEPRALAAHSNRPPLKLRSALRIFFGESFVQALGSVRFWVNRESALSYYYWRKHFRLALGAHAGILRRHGTRLLLLSEDNLSYQTDIWTRAAVQQGVRSVILPFTVSGPNEFGEGFFRVRAHQTSNLSGCWISHRYPHWTYQYRGRRLLRLPPGEILAREAEGLVPPLPWILNSGSADRLAVESPVMLQHYQRQGIPEAQMQVTGTFSDDELALLSENKAEAKRSLCLRYGLDPALPLFLCSLPPNQFALSGNQTEFSSYQHLISAWIGAFDQPFPANVIFKVHPRHTVESFASFCDSKVRFATEDTATLIPAADFYVASVSATIRWALAAGKPVVNYDSYRLRYSDYKASSAVLHVEDLEEFKAQLRQLAVDETFTATLKTRAREEATEWGCLDGKSAQRIIALFDRLIGTSGDGHTKNALRHDPAAHLGRI